MLRDFSALMGTGRVFKVGLGAIARSGRGVAGCGAAGLAGAGLAWLDEGRPGLMAQVVVAGWLVVLAAGFVGYESFRARPRLLFLRVRKPMSRGTKPDGRR
jgi:hypothetical protein